MKILIIGDSCRDVFVYCDAIRLAPDVPVPILSIVEKTENPGMSENVYRNVINLGVDCDITTNYNWKDITKTRYVHHKSNYYFFRVDSTDVIDRIDLRKLSFDYDLIAISDYNKGFLLEEDIEYISKNHKNVFIDTKKKLGEWIENVSYVKINNFEYEKSIDYINNSKIKNRIITTSGEKGCFFEGKNYPTKKVEVKDSSGAGDTFFASLIVEYVKTNNIYKSIEYANKNASEIVRHRGVGLINKI